MIGSKCAAALSRCARVTLHAVTLRTGHAVYGHAAHSHAEDVSHSCHRSKCKASRNSFAIRIVTVRADACELSDGSRSARDPASSDSIVAIEPCVK
jgi:hypothetical protein